MNRPNVLISGAGIAGPALACWLTRRGWDTTVVERAPAFRTGGQHVDIRGAAREVLRRASRPAKRIGAQLFSPPAARIELPDYGHLERTVHHS